MLKASSKEIAAAKSLAPQPVSPTNAGRFAKLCRADKVLLSAGATVLGSTALFGLSPLAIGIPAGAFLAVLADAVFRPSSGTFYPTVSHGRRDRRQIALTFDDGPDAETTPRVLDTLARHTARATFFVIGRNLERTLSLGERTVREGHELGNHSWRHAHWQNFYVTRAHLADIERNERLIQSMTQRLSPPLYRAPVGLKSPEFARAAHKKALTVVAWSVHSRDTIDDDARRVSRRVLSRVQPGDIILMHDGHPTPGRHRLSASDALPFVLEGLRERGLEPVTVSELLQA
jgi:peptidoglycan/xylan/chitin deacetylase (PgdA/CDA1 family)